MTNAAGADRRGAGDGTPARRTYRRGDRLTHAKEYDAAYGARVRKSAGPLTVHGVPNGLDRPRLGLSVGRRVGGAVVRNRVKRLLREAFRLSRAELPVGEGGSYDLVVGVRAHTAARLEDYVRWLTEAAAAVHREWEHRAQREARRRTESPRGPGEGDASD